MSDHFGVMNGEVVNVPSLSAPGFIKASADGSFADVSAAFGGDLILTLRSKTAEYKGFRVSFAAGTASPSYACAGGGSIPFSRGCYKTKFSLPPSAASTFVDIRIPFSNFSDLWSPATGEQTKTCAEDSSACPTVKALASIKRFEIWAEGVNGQVEIEVKAVTASPATSLLGGTRPKFSARPPVQYDTCQGAVQPKLKFGISGRTDPTVPVPVDADESLAEAVCCDKRTKLYAEPQFLFQAPDIALFEKLPSGEQPTTFFDSVCGLAVFRTPVGRSLAEFKADTTEHGWPSFRSAEVVAENVLTNKTSGLVYSKCGTHL